MGVSAMGDSPPRHVHSDREDFIKLVELGILPTSNDPDQSIYSIQYLFCFLVIFPCLHICCLGFLGWSPGSLHNF